MGHKSDWEPQNTKEERERLKKELEEIKKNPPACQPTYNDGHALAAKIAGYIVGQRHAEKPLTAAGVAIACGLSRKTIWTYGKGDEDHWTRETIDKCRDTLDDETRPVYDYLIGGPHDEPRRVLLSYVVGQYNEIAAMEREERLYTRGGVADIFALKAVDGWQDNTAPATGTINNTLVIGGDSADKALELLGYKKALPDTGTK